MSVFELPREFHSGFQNPKISPIEDFEIDWRHPIVRGLKVALVGGNKRDLVTGIDFDIASGSIEKQYPDRSEALVMNPARVSASIKTGIDGSEDRTLFVITRNDDGTSSNNIFAVGTNGTGTRWTVRNDASAIRLEIQGAASIVGAFNLNDANFHTIAIRQQDGTTLGDANHYVDSTFGDFAGTATVNTTGDGIVLGSPAITDTGSTENRSYRVVYYWNRALSNVEIELLAASPYIFLKPVIPLQYFMPEVVGVNLISQARSKSRFVFSRVHGRVN